MNDEPISNRELIAAYRSQVRPSAAARERMLRNITDPRRVAPAPPTAPARQTTAWLALAAAVVLVGLSAYLLAGARHDAQVAPADMMMAPQVLPQTTDAVTTARDPGESSHTTPPPAIEPPEIDPPTIEPPTIESPPREQLAPTAAPPVDPPHRRVTPRAEPSGDQVLAELELIQRIKEALDRGQPQQALTLVDRHARSFARGTLIEEREALRVVALCDANDPRGSRARKKFQANYPRSAYRERVRSACPTDDSSHFP